MLVLKNFAFLGSLPFSMLGYSITEKLTYEIKDMKKFKELIDKTVIKRHAENLTEHAS